MNIRHIMGTFLVAFVVAGCNDNKTSTQPEISEKSVSVAHQWNEVVLDAIRKDRARPPIQARNLFHISAAMYDAWAIQDSTATTYLLGKTLNGFSCPLAKLPKYTNIQAAREEALSYASYQLIKRRYIQSPGYASTMQKANALMAELGFSTDVVATDYATGSAATLGNYIAGCYVNYGSQDGSNEAGSHANIDYTSVNPPIDPTQPGNPTILDLNRWQPIKLANFIDQNGNVVVGGASAFLAAEWGRVKPFSLLPSQKIIHQRNGAEYPVYLDPGAPPQIGGELSAEYQWSFSLVAKWSSHLDPTDGVIVDISPGGIGGINIFPETYHDQQLFYDEHTGSDHSTGRKINPKTNKPYEPQSVPRGDYVRVLAEFWADGPNSETPPGHWFTIFNKVALDPALIRKFRGSGREMGPLEWDVKGYFALGGAMHDAAIAAWGIKGWYDSVRPVSAIRAMADLGQSSDINLPHYHPNGLPLDPGYIELVKNGDPLAGAQNEHVNKIKIKAWKGPDFIKDPKTDVAGVDWILAENWWSYQRPSFVTPPFAGFVSGHSTYSRAAAEVMTAITGDEYFPNGMATFMAKKNEFLVFEEGPSVDVTLQWATYRDAADQCSLSRIWGGIHPPMDDIAGRKIGEKIGVQSVDFAERFFKGTGG